MTTLLVGFSCPLVPFLTTPRCLKTEFTALYEPMLTDQQITKFQAIYKARFHKDLSREEAVEKGLKLVRMMQLIYKPMTEIDYQKLQERRRQTANL